MVFFWNVKRSIGAVRDSKKETVAVMGVWRGLQPLQFAQE
jgi:hypothetical protein